MRYFRPVVVLIALLPLLVQAGIYRWTDENGQVHFSDRPVGQQNSERVELRINTYQQVDYQGMLDQVPARPPTVVMYATDWCPHCTRAREHFQRNNIAFREFDIDKDPNAKRRYDALGGKGVPVILIGDERMNGFNPERFDRLFNKR